MFELWWNWSLMQSVLIKGYSFKESTIKSHYKDTRLLEKSFIKSRTQQLLCILAWHGSVQGVLTHVFMIYILFQLCLDKHCKVQLDAEHRNELCLLYGCTLFLYDSLGQMCQPPEWKMEALSSISSCSTGKSFHLRSFILYICLGREELLMCRRKFKSLSVFVWSFDIS